MSREEIYDHLARVYLGKSTKEDQKKKKQFNAWLLINIVITVLIFSSVFYGLTAFLTSQSESLQKNIVFPLHNGPIRVAYNFKETPIPTKSFSLSISDLDVTQYSRIAFSIRAKEEGSPGVVKILLRNERNETAAYYIQGVNFSWREFEIPLAEFTQITDWGTLAEVSFILESWNVEKQKGVILIDDLGFLS